MNIKKQVREAWKFLKESKRYFLFVFLIMILGGIVGVIYSAELEKIIEPFLKDLVDSISGLGWFQLIVFIFQNNLKVAFLGIILGVIFGIMPFVNSIANGVVIGYVFQITAKAESIFDIWRILPHGIFELPAIIIALGLGIKLGVSFFSKGNFYKVFYNCTNAFLFIIFPLLVIAAIIEGSLIFLIG